MQCQVVLSLTFGIFSGTSRQERRAEELMTIDAEDILASRVVGQNSLVSSPSSVETESAYD
jgi:hypothetical protein